MKNIKPILALAVLALAVWAARSKLRSERVANASTVATLLKITCKPIFKWAADRALSGRYLDRNEPNKGRFTRGDVDRILKQTWRNYDELVTNAHVERLKTLGNRQNVLLGVASLALYRALQAARVEKAYAIELVSDLAWKVYEKWIILPRFIARRATSDPQKQMDLMLRMFLRYPFSRPGYDWKVLPEPCTFAVNIYRCPVYDYLKTQGEAEFMLNTWCTLDFALTQVMTRGGCYERPHTLSAGDDVCDMKWYGEAKTADVGESSASRARGQPQVG